MNHVLTIQITGSRLISFNPFLRSNVADFSDRLPKSIVAKGGVFIVSLLQVRYYMRTWGPLSLKGDSAEQSMYQREALWTSFNSTRPRDEQFAVKVSVGGINALTGHSAENPTPPGVQDYLAIGGPNEQL